MKKLYYDEIEKSGGIWIESEVSGVPIYTVYFRNESDLALCEMLKDGT